jgi:hypothetical protein
MRELMAGIARYARRETTFRGRTSERGTFDKELPPDSRKAGRCNKDPGSSEPVARGSSTFVGNGTPLGR